MGYGNLSILCDFNLAQLLINSVQNRLSATYPFAVNSALKNLLRGPGRWLWGLEQMPGIHKAHIQ